MGKGQVINTFKHICKVCGARFTSTSRHSEYCSTECSEYGREQKRQSLRRSQSLEPLLKICREIDAYNKEHGTRLSYGQYVSGRRQ